MKLAFADGKRHVTDPVCMDLPSRMLLDPAYGSARAKLITQTAALPAAGMPPKSGTVFLCAADGEGNMVSYIQSNYMGFGSGVVVRGTGIALQNRGHDFSLNPDDRNALAPRWRWLRDRRFLVEGSFSKEIAGQLAERGHQVGAALDRTHFSRGQVILKGENGTLIDGTQGRTDSNIACF